MVLSKQGDLKERVYILMYKTKTSTGFCLVTSVSATDAQDVAKKQFGQEIEITKTDFSHFLKGRVEHEVIYNYKS